jgi:hypothetical protein
MLASWWRKIERETESQRASEGEARERVNERGASE